jgi:serine protease Do
MKFLKKIIILSSIFFIFCNQLNAQDKKTLESKTKVFSEDKIDIIPPKSQLSNSFADIVEDLLPTVVNISSVQESNGIGSKIDEIILGEMPKSQILDDLKKQLEKQLQGNDQRKKISSIGSGFVISKDGLIVTNSHVISDGSDISVNLNDGSKYKAKVIGIDKKSDLALLKINPNKELKFAKFGDSTKSRIGDWVIVIGNPYNLGGSVSIGIVSARGRDINNGQSDEFIQTDAAINKGNSGGPMFNIKGEVIGISTAIFSPSGGSVGIGFATPSSTAIQVVKQLKEQGEVTRGWIGVSVQDVKDEMAQSIKMDRARGAFVTETVKNGPADKAGILPTDIIIKFEDIEIEEMKELPKMVSKFPIGKIATVQVLRQGKIKNIKVTVEKMKDDESKKVDNKITDKKPSIKPATQILGLGLAELKSRIKKDKKEINLEGLLVVEVSPKSEASEKGIIIGDIILSVNQTTVKTIDDIKTIIEDSNKSSNKKLFLFIKRDNNNFAVVLNIAKPLENKASK